MTIDLNFVGTRKSISEFRSSSQREVDGEIGRDPYAFVNLLDRIIPNDGESTGWLSTHSSNFDRRAGIKEALEGQQ